MTDLPRTIEEIEREILDDIEDFRERISAAGKDSATPSLRHAARTVLTFWEAFLRNSGRIASTSCLGDPPTLH